MLVAQPLADGGQTDAAIDQLSGVTVPELMQRAGHTCLRGVALPAFLHTLVAQRSPSAIPGRLKGFWQLNSEEVKLLVVQPEVQAACCIASRQTCTAEV